MDNTVKTKPETQTQLDKDMTEITKSLNRPTMPIQQVGMNKSKTIIDRLNHIRNELFELDADLAKLQSDIADRVGVR